MRWRHTGLLVPRSLNKTAPYIRSSRPVACESRVCSASCQSLSRDQRSRRAIAPPLRPRSSNRLSNRQVGCASALAVRRYRIYAQRVSFPPLSSVAFLRISLCRQFDLWIWVLLLLSDPRQCHFCNINTLSFSSVQCSSD